MEGRDEHREFWMGHAKACLENDNALAESKNASTVREPKAIHGGASIT